MRSLEIAVQYGDAVLLENVPEELDPVLESVLLKQVVKSGGATQIKVGDNMVEYDPNFRLYVKEFFFFSFSCCDSCNRNNSASEGSRRRVLRSCVPFAGNAVGQA